MSRYALTAQPQFPGHSVTVGYEKQLPSFFAYVFTADGDPVVVEDGLVDPITDPAAILDAVRPYAVIPEGFAAQLAAAPSVELTATQRAQRAQRS